MQNHQVQYHLSRLAQNANRLAIELQAQHDAEPRGAEERPALIQKLAATVRADFAAVESNLPAEGS